VGGLFIDNPAGGSFIFAKKLGKLKLAHERR
jgi:hypothetical protein